MTGPTGPLRIPPEVLRQLKLKWRLRVRWCRVTTVVLLRHADIDLPPTGTDPVLNTFGVARAQELAHQLGLTAVSAIYASTFRRTQLTAQPLADHTGQPVLIRDSGASTELAAEILTNHRGGLVVVVGHSNTVPELITGLGATFTGGPIAESDFDNLFWLTITSCGTRRLFQLRYGATT